jgi:hypothetical protein
MSKPDADDARHVRLARIAADQFLRILDLNRPPSGLLTAGDGSQSDEVKLIVDFMVSGAGFDLAYVARVRRARLLFDLDDLAHNLAKLAEPVEGGGDE